MIDNGEIQFIYNVLSCSVTRVVPRRYGCIVLSPCLALPSSDSVLLCGIDKCIELQ